MEDCKLIVRHPQEVYSFLNVHSNVAENIVYKCFLSSLNSSLPKLLNLVRSLIFIIVLIVGIFNHLEWIQKISY